MEQLIDSKAVVDRKRRALRNRVDGADFLMRDAAQELADRLSAVERRFPRAAVLLTPTGLAADTLRAAGKVDEVVEVAAHRDLLDGPGTVAEGDRLPLEPSSLDLAVSLLSMQELNDIPGFLIQVRRALKPDGLFIGAMAGAGTLTELRDALLAAETQLAGGASPRVLPFADVRDAGALLQRAGFALPVADHDDLTVRYATMFDLMRDLRAMGVTNVLAGRSRRPATRALFTHAAQIYAGRHSDADGRIRATFSLVWMSGWAPADSQRKPLRPGSAQVSLARVLEDPEG